MQYSRTSSGARTEFEPASSRRHTTSFERVEDRSGLGGVHVVLGPIGGQRIEEGSHLLGPSAVPCPIERDLTREFAYRVIGPGKGFRIARPLSIIELHE